MRSVRDVPAAPPRLPVLGAHGVEGRVFWPGVRHASVAAGVDPLGTLAALHRAFAWPRLEGNSANEHIATPDLVQLLPQRPSILEDHRALTDVSMRHTDLACRAAGARFGNTRPRRLPHARSCGRRRVRDRCLAARVAAGGSAHRNGCESNPIPEVQESPRQSYERPTDGRAGQPAAVQSRSR
jgi:hypothetical protein